MHVPATAIDRVQASDALPVSNPHTALLHLFRLISPSMPVGSFSYSRGLESAVELGWVTDETSAAEWIGGTLEHLYAPLDGALFLRMMAALAAGDLQAFLGHDERLGASRESRELQLEDLRMGAALLRLLRGLEVAAGFDHADRELGFPAAFALAAHHWRVPPDTALRGLMWSVLEGQVSAAIRLVPLGQTAGQRIMIGAVETLERAAHVAGTIDDDAIGNAAPRLAMASAWHEKQYSRLFRS